MRKSISIILILIFSCVEHKFSFKISPEGKYEVEYKAHGDKNDLINFDFSMPTGDKWEINSTMDIVQSKDSLYAESYREPTRNINLLYISNKIHNPLNPNGGSFISLSSSLYGTVLGGTKHFLKVKAEYRKYFTLYE